MRLEVSNLAGYKEMPDVIDGTYIVTIAKSYGFRSKTKGTPGHKLEMQIVEGPQQPIFDPTGNVSSYVPPNGRFIFATLWLPSSEQADGGNMCGLRMKQLCEAADVAFDDTGYDTDDFVGKMLKVRTKLKLDEFSQNYRAEVQKYIHL